MSLQILYEDNHLIAVNKPAGWLVQGDDTGDLPLAEWVKRYIKDRYQKPGAVFLGVIHRIDRPVSGVVVFARTSKALERMNKLFREREIEKTYWAVTAIRPEPIEGTLTHFLTKDTTRNVAKAYNTLSRRAKNAKKSVLNYEVIGGLGAHSLVQVKPITGRPHQIRVQLSKMGWPIKGDIKYGAERPNRDGSIHLHCRSLGFIHPVKKEPVLIEANPPIDQIWDLFEGVWE